MGTPGRVMIRADGKRGVLASGKAAVFNAGGECAECCLEPGDACGFCEGVTPLTFEVVLSSITPCCIPGSAGVGRPDFKVASPILGTFALTQSGETACQWLGNATENLMYLYASNDGSCVGVAGSAAVTPGIVLTKTNDTSWVLSVAVTYPSPVYSFNMFYSAILSQPTSCTGELVFTNREVCVGTDGGYGGAATVNPI